MLDFVTAFTVASSLFFTSPQFILAASAMNDATTIEQPAPKEKKRFLSGLDGLDERKELVVGDLQIKLGEKVYLLKSNDFGGMDYIQSEVTSILASGAVFLTDYAEPRQEHPLLSKAVPKLIKTQENVSPLYEIAKAKKGQTRSTSSGQKFVVGSLNSLINQKTDKKTFVKIIHMSDNFVWVSYFDDPQKIALLSPKLLAEKIITQPKRGTRALTDNGVQFIIKKTYYLDTGYGVKNPAVSVLEVKGKQVRIKYKDSSKRDEFVSDQDVYTQAVIRDIENRRAENTGVALTGLAILGIGALLFGGDGSDDGGHTECARDPNCVKGTIMGMQPRY